MSTKKGLRKHSKKFPEAPEIEKMFEGLSGQPDHTATLIASAIVESFLERLITRRLKHKDAEMLNNLFDNRGPLSDFHSKIIVAHALGFISSPLASELATLKDIRNCFAHSRHLIDFETSEVVAEMQNLKMIGAVNKAKRESFPEELPLVGKPGYVLTCQIICIMMDPKHEQEAKGIIS